MAQTKWYIAFLSTCSRWPFHQATRHESEQNRRGLRPGRRFTGLPHWGWDTGYISKLYLGGQVYLSASGSSLAINGTAISTGSDFAGKIVKMGGSSTYYITANTSRQLCPSSISSTYPFYLGTSSAYWQYAYIGSTQIQIGSSTSSKIGFFGTTAIARQTLSTTSNNMSYSSATSSNYLHCLNNVIGILKKYGLIG